MPNLTVSIKTFALALLLLFLALWPVAQCLGLIKRRPRTSGLGPLLLVVALISLLLLSGCGTVPSPAPTRQPVPAALLVPPRKPTLLVLKPQALSLDDAWANHATNAKSCADDRQRFQHLIDFLERK